MAENPLALPSPASPALGSFLDHFGLDRRRGPAELIGDLTRAFARLPYENLSKILKRAAESGAERARRGPVEVIGDHIALGAGGTCFSLTAALLHLLRALGYTAEPILADRHYGPDTHCALLVWLDGEPNLVDPGYLIFDPIPLAGLTEWSRCTGFNELILTSQSDDARIDLSTRVAGNTRHRLTFKTDPADAGEFLRAWDASFDWDMMHYPVLTRATEQEHVYLQERRLQVRGAEASRRAELSLEKLPGVITRQFGIHPKLVHRALEVLARERRHDDRTVRA